jgi:hypothetical protein
MFEITKDSRFTIEERLLYNIWQELRRLNTVPVETPLENKKDENIYSCKECEYKTENKGSFLAHARKHKKDAKEGA